MRTPIVVLRYYIKADIILKLKEDKLIEVYSKIVKKLRCLLEDKYLNAKAKLISDKDLEFPYVIIDDKAFTLTNYMLHIHKEIFKYK